MSKTYTQEQLDKILEKESVKQEKATAAATKAETKRVLDLIKDATAANKEVKSKEVKTHVANVLKELVAEIKAA